MNSNGKDNPAQVSQDDLLRFLDEGPKLMGLPRNRELAVESPSGETYHPACPAAESYLELSSGAVLGDAAEILLAHAARCTACGEILAEAVNALEGAPSPEEASAIAEMAAAQSEWQRKIALELAATPVRKRSGALHPGLWMAGAAIAAGLALAAGLFLWQRQAITPDRQLALAYEQSRTLELRVPEAGYAALSAAGHTRGTSADHEPAPLLDARAQLARDLARAPQDAHWLELQARADVLEERYSSATDVLDRLLAQGPVSANLLSDAATAYYQRGLVSGSELDRSTALDYLRRADQLAPTDPVILFNEAIVMEDRGQMMNAAEVWNRYITVERDPQWAAEGRRKLASLEKTLNRLKSHQDRIDKMLSSPQEMDALAVQPQRLASLDEELSSYELDRLLLAAYPPAGNSSTGSPQTRGSPNPETCLATRRLLQAIASSLERQHHDPWLSDLLSADIDSLPATTASSYTKALQLLAHAVRQDLTGVPAVGKQYARESQVLFEQLGKQQQAGSPLATMTRAGEDRAAVEEMFATQREVNFKECRLLAFERRRGLQPERHPVRYPWIETQALITEDVCDDAPEMRSAGRALISNASSLAEANGYRLLNARIEMILAGDAGNVGDDETAERLLLKALRDLDSQDSPPYRIANTVSELQYLEQDSNRRYVAELSLKEAVEWLKLEGNHFLESAMRMLLARAEIRIGAMKEAENQLQLSQGGIEAFRKGNTGWTNFTEAQIFLANSLLERSDLEGAAYYLDQTAAHMAGYSDLWGLRAYAAALGQLQLARGHLDEAARTLETEIRGSEEGSVRGADQATVAEYAQQDHDLYAELAAVWLAQGRSPESVLALWERFRLRSRGLPIAQCPGIALDCEEPKLLAARRELGDNILIGQIVLLDRVLAYRADRNGVTWSQRPLRRQDVLDAARSLEQAVSSPLTSPETAAKLGAGLAPALVPPIPAKLPADSALLLEPDPMLVNLAWPVLPTRAGPLGLQYSLAEIRSLLASRSEQDAGGISEAQTIGKRALIVGASVASANESPLPEAMDEAWSVSRLLHSSSPLLGTQATTASVGQSLSSATIFHFAGHAVQTRNGTELLLAAASPKDATPWIDGAFLRRHPPRFCRLAVLSACATGTREESWNRPLQDIVETLGSLGVPEVVATRWQIDSEAALPFMDVFYGNLAQGKSVALALTSARRVQFAQSLYRNPYYWGAYYATGREMTSSEEESHAGNQRIAKAEEK